MARRRCSSSRMFMSCSRRSVSRPLLFSTMARISTASVSRSADARSGMRTHDRRITSRTTVSMLSSSPKKAFVIVTSDQGRKPAPNRNAPRSKSAQCLSYAAVGKPPDLSQALKNVLLTFAMVKARITRAFLSRQIG